VSILLRAAPYALAVLLVLGSLYGAYRHGVTTEHNRNAAAVSAQQLEAARMVITEQNRSTARAVALDAHYTGVLINAQRKIEELERGSADAKPVRVFVRATCPSVPEASAAASVGDRSGQGAELKGVVRSDYFDHLRAIEVKEAALAFCIERSKE
jgi:hypothetical protein